MSGDVTGGLRKAQHRFVAHVVVAVAGAVLCFPHWRDAGRLRALEDLNALSESLDPTALSARLQTQAELGANLDLASLLKDVAGPGVSKVEAGDGGTQLFAGQRPRIQNLRDVVERSAGGQELAVVGPDVGALSDPLRWRIARLGGSGTVESLRLVPGSADGTSLEAEAAVEPLRQAALRERALFDKLDAAHEYRVRRTKTLWKIKAPKKQQWKAHGERREARDAMLAQQAVLEKADARYEAAATKALAFEAGTQTDAPGVVVEADFVADGGKPGTLRMPASRVERTLISVAVPLPESLTRLTQHALWPEIRGVSAAAATAHVEQQLSWQLAGTRVAGVRVGAMTLLQLWPLLMWLTAFLLGRTCRGAQHSFNPFDHPGRNLPRVGTGMRQLDKALLVVPVAITTLIGVVTLARIDAAAWLAAALGAIAIAQGVFAARAVDDVNLLRREIVRTSVPAPLPAATERS